MANSSFTNLAEFFKLIGNLKHLKRTGWVRKDIADPETVAGHMYRMAMMSFVSGESQKIDQIRVMKMSLVHDLSESIVGDLTPHCGVSVEDKHAREDQAMKKIQQLLKEDVGKELYSLFQEYEEQQTPEAKLVKDLDKFDMIFQAYEYELKQNTPGSLEEFFESTRGKFHSEEVSQWANELENLRLQKKS